MATVPRLPQEEYEQGTTLRGSGSSPGVGVNPEGVGVNPEWVRVNPEGVRVNPERLLCGVVGCSDRRALARIEPRPQKACCEARARLVP